MAVPRLFLFAGGLSFIPLLFVSGGLQANGPMAPTATATETSSIGGSVTSTSGGAPATETSAASPVKSVVAAAPVTVTSTTQSGPVGPTSNQPITGPTNGSPPEPAPLPALAAPSTGETPPNQPVGQSLTGARVEGVLDSEAQLSIAGAALSTAAATPTTNSSMPATPPSDVIDDAAPITQSVFDGDDAANHHPVHSAASITSSSFDQEDRTDEHPVP